MSLASLYSLTTICTDAGCAPNRGPHLQLAAIAVDISHTDAAVDQLINFATSVSALYLCSLLPPKLLLYEVQDTQSPVRSELAKD